MINSYPIIQEMIDIVRNGKKPADTIYLRNLKLDEFTIRKLSIPRLLSWLLSQKFPGDTSSTKHNSAFSSKQVVQLINETSDLQKYFQIKDGELAFANGLSEEEAMEMIVYVKKHYKPEDPILDFF